MIERSFFAGQLLIAMPCLQDPSFSRSVTYLCQHTQQGAMGIGISKAANLRLIDVLEQMNIETDLPEVASQPVMLGGPVHNDRGFVLHEAGENYDSTWQLSDTLSLTSSKDLLEAIAVGQGPRRYLVALGYSGWSEGQLEEEFAQNSWLTAPFDRDLVFTTPLENRWQRAAALSGVNITQMANYVGHA
jgi:putative transcriptional regulator